MNKTELIEQVAKEAGISKAAASKAIDAFTDSVTAVLARLPFPSAQLVQAATRKLDKS
jgi:hypothetical protein